MPHQLMRVPSAGGTASRSRTGRVRSARDIPGRYPGRYPGRLSRAGPCHPIATVPSESRFIDALAFSARQPPRRRQLRRHRHDAQPRQPAPPRPRRDHADGDRPQIAASASTVGYLAFSVPALIAGTATSRYGPHKTTQVYSVAIAVLVTAAPASFPFRHRSPADGPELAAAQPDPLPGPRTVPGQAPPHKAGPQSWPPGPAPCRSAPRTGRSQPAPGPNRRSPHTDRRSPHTAVSAGPGRLLIWWHCLR